MSADSAHIRVLSVCTSDSSGGAARAAYRIHQGVRSLGVESRMFVKHKASNDSAVHTLSEFVPNNPLFRALDWCALKWKNIIQQFNWSSYPIRDQNYKSDLRATNLHGALQSIDYDVLHLHWINNRFLNIDELAKIHKPIVWTLHDSWPFCGVCHYFLDCKGYQQQCGACPQLGSTNPRDLSYRVWRRKQSAYSQLDLHIVAPSRWMAECARRSTLFRDCDIRVIPNCIDIDVFRPLSRQEILSIAEGQKNATLKRVLCEASEEKASTKPIILYGAMQAATDKIKGFQGLLSALQILDQKGFEAHLVVFGAYKQDLPMHFHNIDVTFVGYVFNTSVLTALYSCADVAVVPSLTENLSCTIMESMACGTPVTAFDIGGNGDMIEHQSNGYLAQANDSEDLANGIMYCIEQNPNNILGNNARESVEKHYFMSVVAMQYQELYQSIK